MVSAEYFTSETAFNVWKKKNKQTNLLEVKMFCQIRKDA